MSTTRLLILGLVRWLQPIHGYDIRRELQSWNVQEWADLQPGSIYHALRKLTADGLLEEVATKQVGSRPARTTYRVTKLGEEHFAELLHGQWWGYSHVVDPFVAAVGFLPALPRSQAVEALRRRAERLRVMVAEKQAVLAAMRQAPGEQKPPHVYWQIELGLDRFEVEASWCERVADRVAAGEGYHVGEGLDEVNSRWRVSLGMPEGEPATSGD